MPFELPPAWQPVIATARAAWSSVLRIITWPLRTWKYLLILALVGFYVYWTGKQTLITARMVGRVNLFGLETTLYFNFWGFIGGLVLFLLILNPFRWLNAKRMIFGGIGLGIVLGRLLGGPFVPMLAAFQLNDDLVFYGMPFALMLGGALAIMAIASVVGLVFGIFVGIPVTLFNQIFQFERSLKIFRYQQNGLAGYIVRFVLWLRNETLPDDSGADDSKGARFATRPELVARHNADVKNAASMSFGHWGDADIPFFLHTDKHILIMASTRSGKGVTLIIPHLLRYQGSAFVLDPKGENARATGRQRAQLNQKVHYLDPFGISGKPQSRFNPLARFTPQNMEAESKALAAALFVVGDRERDHWTAAGQQLLAAIILYVYVSDDIPADKKDLPTVRKVLLGGLKPALEAMTLIDAADGLLRDLAVSFLETPEKEFGSVVSTAQRQTEILDNPFMIKCLAATGDGQEVDFKQWHKGTMTVYLCLAAPKFPTFNRWLRLVLTSALDEMTDTLNPPALPVCFMLDELATLGHLASVENAVGLAAGYGVQLISVFQDVAQMRDLYKGRWASFIGNAGVRALFNLDDFDTAEYWSKFMGGRLVETHGRQEDIYGFSKGDNIGEAMRPLLSSDKIMMDFSSGQMLVLAQGLHPTITRRVAYFLDNSLQGTWDDPRGPGAAPTTPRPAPSTPQPQSNAPPPTAARTAAAAPAPAGTQRTQPTAAKTPAPTPDYTFAGFYGGTRWQASGKPPEKPASSPKLPLFTARPAPRRDGENER